MQYLLIALLLVTGKDIDNCIAGVVTILPNPADAEKADDVSQTEGSWEDMKQLKVDLKKVTDENEERKKENDKLKTEVEDLRKKLEEEKADHAFARQELDKNARRVLAMLGTPSADHASMYYYALLTFQLFNLKIIFEFFRRQ